MNSVYDNIVRQWYEDIKPLFINYLRKNFYIDYDGIMDIYQNVWEDVHSNIKRGRVKKDTKWTAYILKMGWNQAYKHKIRRPQQQSLDDESFDLQGFELELARQRQEEEPSIYDDPAVKGVLGAELSYIPNPCNKILKLYYFDELTMTEIADSMNYSSSDSVKTTKNRCMDKLRKRVLSAVKRLGVIV